jgi:hypothetical protein
MLIVGTVIAGFSVLALGGLAALTWLTTVRRLVIAAFVLVSLLSLGAWMLYTIDTHRREGSTIVASSPFVGLMEAEALRALSAINERYGGLPAGVAMLEREQGGYSLRAGTLVSLPQSYQLADLRFFDETPLIEALLDDDPEYQIEARVVLTTRDGDEQWFEMSTWRYGLYLGFMTLPPGGDGPGWRWRPIGGR